VWVWIFLGIGLVALLSLVGWAVWLLHKAADVWSEVTVLGRRADQVGALLDQLVLEPDTDHLEDVRRRTRTGRRA
jgi:TM2 domain-containing membrane protein YozV